MQLRDPIVVIPRSRRRLGSHPLRVRRPVEVIDVHVGGGDNAKMLRRDVDHRDPLLVDRLLDDADRARHRDQRSCGALRILDEEKRDRFSVRRPARLRDVAADLRDLFSVDEQLLAVDVGKGLRIRRPGEAVVVGGGQLLAIRAVDVRGPDAVLALRPRDVFAVRRDRDFVE